MADFLGADAETWGLTLLAMSEVPNFMAGLAPSLYTYRQMVGKGGKHQAEAKETHRRAEIIGSAFSLAVGIGASMVTESWLPIIGCSVTLAVYLSQYRWALDNPHEAADEMFNG